MGEGIAMAYLPPAFSAPGTAVEIEVRGRRYAATITTLPFYKKP
jgi:aminomethyltransferase